MLLHQCATVLNSNADHNVTNYFKKITFGLFGLLRIFFMHDEWKVRRHCIHLSVARLVCKASGKALMHNDAKTDKVTINSKFEILRYIRPTLLRFWNFFIEIWIFRKKCRIYISVCVSLSARARKVVDPLRIHALLLFIWLRLPPNLMDYKTDGTKHKIWF